MQGPPALPNPDLNVQKKTVDAFLAALRRGDIQGLIAVLDPDVVVHVDGASAFAGQTVEVRGAENWAKGAVAFAALANSARPVLVDGNVGMIFAPRGKLQRVVSLQFKGDKIVQVEIVGESARLTEFNLGVLEGETPVS